MDDQDLSNVSNGASVVEERHPSVVIVDDCHIKREGKVVTAQDTASGDSLIGPLYEVFDGTRMVKLTKEELYELYKECMLHQNWKHASEDAKISNTYFPRSGWKIESRDDSEEWVKSYMEGEGNHIFNTQLRKANLPGKLLTRGFYILQGCISVRG